MCREDIVPRDLVAERGWRAFKVEGPIDLATVGVMSAISAPLAEARISLFAVSTYDTDYVLVRAADFDEACEVLAEYFQVVVD